MCRGELCSPVYNKFCSAILKNEYCKLHRAYLSLRGGMKPPLTMDFECGNVGNGLVRSAVSKNYKGTKKYIDKFLITI